MRIQRENSICEIARRGLLVALLALFIPGEALAVGSWTSLVNLAPDSPAGRTGHMLLLSDGTVMVQNYDQTGWFRLMPDTNGSYITGTWTNIAPMHDGRGYYSSVVLRDGRVFVAGGEYQTGTTNAEIYDPLNNTWTQ